MSMEWVKAPGAGVQWCLLYKGNWDIIVGWARWYTNEGWWVCKVRQAPPTGPITKYVGRSYSLGDAKECVEAAVVEAALSV